MPACPALFLLQRSAAKRTIKVPLEPASCSRHQTGNLGTDACGPAAPASLCSALCEQQPCLQRKKSSLSAAAAPLPQAARLRGRPDRLPACPPARLGKSEVYHQVCVYAQRKPHRVT